MVDNDKWFTHKVDTRTGQKFCSKCSSTQAIFDATQGTIKVQL